ncbi:Ig-like domain-containing protein, partial [Flavonifractor hominis]
DVQLQAGENTVKLTSDVMGFDLDSIIVQDVTWETETPEPAPDTPDPEPPKPDLDSFDGFAIEAEDPSVVLENGVIAKNHTGYKGTGFYDPDAGKIGTIQWTANIPETDKYTVAFRYTSLGGRPCDLYIDGVNVQSYKFYTDGNLQNEAWTTWLTEGYEFQLTEGEHTFKLVNTTVNGPNIDRMIISRDGTVYEAEDGTMSGGTAAASARTGYTGTGYADYGGAGSYVELEITVATFSPYDIEVRYATADPRPCTVYLDDQVIGTLSCVPGGSGDAAWTAWVNETIRDVPINGGSHKLKIVANASGPNIDRVVVRGGMETADNVAPTVLSSVPSDGAVDVPANQSITLGFSEDVLAGSAYDAISLVDADGMAVELTKSVENRTLTLTPAAELTAGAVYTLTLPAKAVKDAAGNELVQAYTMSFTVSGTPAEQPIRVACVGDSITFGSQSVPNTRNYPTALQEKLGDDYEVKNFGVSGATMRNSADKPYTQQSQYQASLAYEPDIVLIMLGTNDGKSHNWTIGQTENSYVADAMALVESYRALESEPEVWLMTSPTAHGTNSYNIVPANVNDEIVPLQGVVAYELDCQFVDMNLATRDAAEYFPDQIHGNNDGYELIAETVYQTLIGEKSWENPYALTAEIKQAERKNASDYTDDSYAAMQTVLAQAKETLAAGGGQSTYDEAYEALKTAVDNLVEKPKDPILSTGKPVNATSAETKNPAENAVDGNNDTMWAAQDDSYPQSITVDLEGRYDLSEIQLYLPKYGQDNRAYQYEIQVAGEDQQFRLAVDQTDNNDRSGIATFPLAEEGVRYVKIQIISCDGATNAKKNAGVNEIYVRGVPSEEPEPVTYAVTYALTNLTAEGAPAQVEEGQPLNVTLTAEEGYTLPEAVTVTMAGEALTAGEGYTYDSETGSL